MFNLHAVKDAVRMPTDLAAAKHSCEPRHSVVINLALDNIIEMIAFVHNRTREPSPIHEHPLLNPTQLGARCYEFYKVTNAICKCHDVIWRRHAGTDRRQGLQREFDEPIPALLALSSAPPFAPRSKNSEARCAAGSNSALRTMSTGRCESLSYDVLRTSTEH